MQPYVPVPMGPHGHACPPMCMYAHAHEFPSGIYILVKLIHGHK